MPGLRKVPQVMVKNDRDETTAQFPFPIFLFVLWFYPFSFVLFCFFFVSVFFYVTEGEKQGSGVDSVCGVIKREMVAARQGFNGGRKKDCEKNTMQQATNDAQAHKFNNADY